MRYIYETENSIDMTPGKCCKRPECNGCSRGNVINGTIHQQVNCVNCNRYVYNASKESLGIKPRTVSSIHAGIKPKVRASVIMKANSRCELCGMGPPDVNLQVGHILSVKAGIDQGLTEVDLNDEENLIAMCEQCNLGIGEISLPLPMCLRILKARIDHKSKKQAKNQ